MTTRMGTFRGLEACQAIDFVDWKNFVSLGAYVLKFYTLLQNKRAKWFRAAPYRSFENR